MLTLSLSLSLEAAADKTLSAVAIEGPRANVHGTHPPQCVKGLNYLGLFGNNMINILMSLAGKAVKSDKYTDTQTNPSVSA